MSGQETLPALRSLSRFSPMICIPDAGLYPRFEMPQTTAELFGRLSEIATVFNQDGSYNGASSHAERYALCLLHEGHRCEALALFNAIVGNSQSVLLINDPSANDGLYHSKGVADRRGKLGFIGAWWFADLLREHNSQRAQAIYREFAALPPYCPPCGLKDARYNALLLLKEAGVIEINSKPIDDEIRIAYDYVP